MLAIHPNARTTPAVRAEIARSSEPLGRAGPALRRQRRDRPQVAQARAGRLPGPLQPAAPAALEGERGGARRRLRPAPRHRLPARRPHLRGRPLPAAPRPRRGLPHPQGRGPEPPAGAAAPEKAAAKFREYELGFVHVDVKHLPKLRTADGEWRKRFLFVAIDRRSRSVHLAVKDDETEASATAFLREALAAFPFRITHVLTDRGSCFTADGFERALPRARRRAPQDPALHAAHERHGGALQRAGAARGARHHGRQPPRPRAPAGRLQRRLQRPPPARAGRPLARGGRPRAPGGGTRASPTPPTAHRPIRASCPRPCWSSSAPRTSRSRTRTRQSSRPA